MREQFRRGAVCTALLLFTSLTLSAQQADSLFQEAGSAYQSGQYRKAGELYGQFSFLFPQDLRCDDADFLGATAWVQGGEVQKGLEGLRRHARVYPESPYLTQSAYWTGRAWFLLEKWEAAAQAFQTQVNRPGSPDLAAQSRYWWGLSLFRQNRKTEAGQVWGEGDLTSLWGQRSRLQTALLLLEGQRPAEALTHLGKLLNSELSREVLHGVLYYSAEAAFKAGDFSAALVRTDEFFRSFPQDPQELNLRYLRAQALQNLGREGEAVSQYRLCLASGTGEIRNGAAFALGALYHKSGRWSESYTLWAGLEPGNLSPSQQQKRAANAAQAAFRLQKWEDARSWYLKALGGPDRNLAGESLIGASSAAFLARRPGEAMDHLASYLKDFPGAPRREEVALLLLKASLEKQVWEKALVWLDLLIREFPGSAGVLERRLERSRILTREGRFAPALEDVQHILDRNPPQEILGEALYQAAYIYALRAEPLRGEKYLYRLVEQFPPGELRDRALLARGLAFFNAGQSEPAKANWNRLLRESPDSSYGSQAWLNLAALHEREGQALESAEAYRKAAQGLKDTPRYEALLKAGIQTSRINPSQALNHWNTMEQETEGLEKARVQIQKARTLLDLKKEGEAASLLEALVSGGLSGSLPQETWEEAARLLSGVLIRTGGEAEGLLVRWKKNYPRSAYRYESLLAQADSLLKARRFQEAARVAADLLALGVENPLAEAYRIREALAWGEEDLVKARDLFRTYFTLHGQSSTVLGGARSLAALLVRKNSEEELDYWIREISGLTPLVTVATELLLGKGRLILDARWEEGSGLLERILRSPANLNQKAEALALLCEGAVRTSRFSLIKEWARILPGSADPVLRARIRIAEGLAALNQGGGTGVLEALTRDPAVPDDYRAQGLYQIWKFRDGHRDSRAAEAATELKKKYPLSTWASLVP